MYHIYIDIEGYHCICVTQIAIYVKRVLALGNRKVGSWVSFCCNDRALLLTESSLLSCRSCTRSCNCQTYINPAMCDTFESKASL